MKSKAGGPGSLVRFRFKAKVIYWRGPAPYLFAPIPEEHVGRLRLIAKAVTYGWGMVPVDAKVKGIAFKTSLFPKDDAYLLPIKAVVWKKAGIAAGDMIDVEIAVQSDRL